MSGTMSRADLAADVKSMLMDAATHFNANGLPEYYRHLTVAADDLARKKPRVLLTSLTLVADQDLYPAPADLMVPTISTWGDAERRRVRPWQPGYPGASPRLSRVDGVAGPNLRLNPAPTANQISQLGSTFGFYYHGRYTVAPTAAATTVPTYLRSLLLVRAVAQALVELAARGVTKPVRLGDGIGMPAANGTPAGLHLRMMAYFNEMAA